MMPIHWTASAHADLRGPLCCSPFLFPIPDTKILGYSPFILMVYGEMKALAAVSFEDIAKTAHKAYGCHSKDPFLIELITDVEAVLVVAR